MKSLAQHENGELAKWVPRLVEILRNSKGPVSLELVRTSDPQRAVEGIAGKSRAATLKKRIRDWERFAGWLDFECGVKWPTEPSQLVNYLFFLADAPCARTVPLSFLSSLRWFEARAGFPVGSRFCENQLVLRNVEHVTSLLDTEGFLTRKAVRFSMAMVISLELMVEDTTENKVVRLGAWCRLLKVYGVMRSDDLQRIRPEDFELREAGVVGVLRRTKTTGPGKRVRVLPLLIPREAWLAVDSWARTGYKIWKEIIKPNQDFFIAQWDSCQASFFQKPASSHSLAALGRLVVARARMPDWISADRGGR